MRATLIHSHEIAPDVRHFVFEAEGVDRLPFIPGQFVSMSAEIGGKTITRAYSLASAPASGDTEASRFELCLNRVEGGRLSPLLFAMQPGQSIDMRPPLGMFVLRQPPRESLFIATGTGIAPFRSMLQAHFNASSPAITLLHGVRYESHLMYRAEFEDLALRFPQFRFWPTLSRPGESGPDEPRSQAPQPSWEGRVGHVQAHLDEALGSRRDLDAYLCGLKPMVDAVRTILKEMGFDRKQIFYEKYD